MQKYLTLGVATVFALTGINGAHAADLAVKAAPQSYSWAGWYGGLHAGYGWGDPSFTFDPSSLPTPTGVTASVSIASPFVLSTQPSGWLGGLQLGYQKQHGRLVYGLEGDFSWASIKDTNSGSYVNTYTVFGGPNNATLTGTATLEAKLDWLATLRGRVGYSFDKALPYLTGGLALSRVKTTVGNSGSVIYAFPPPANYSFAYSDSFSETLWGFAVGAGVDWAINPRWIVRAEYLYVKFQDKSHATSVPGMSAVNGGGMDLNIARLALNYRFKPE